MSETDNPLKLLRELDRRKAGKVDATKLTEAIVDECKGEAGLARKIVSEWNAAESESVKARYAALVVQLVTGGTQYNDDQSIGAMGDEEVEGAVRELFREQSAGAVRQEAQ